MINLDYFSGAICHGQWTSVESGRGREEEQLAHLVHTTAIYTHHKVLYGATSKQIV